MEENRGYYITGDVLALNRTTVVFLAGLRMRSSHFICLRALSLDFKSLMLTFIVSNFLSSYDADLNQTVLD
jgi:hypothetical protein